MSFIKNLFSIFKNLRVENYLLIVNFFFLENKKWVLKTINKQGFRVNLKTVFKNKFLKNRKQFFNFKNNFFNFLIENCFLKIWLFPFMLDFFSPLNFQRTKHKANN